jgi:hypothetical protein
MAAYQGTPFPINTYETDSVFADHLGSQKDWADEDRSKQFVVKNSAFTVKTILVQNSSGAALTPGMALKWTAGYFGSKVQAATNGVPICGYVPSVIQTAATIPTGAYFWMIIHGPTDILKDAGNVAEGDQLEAGATAGYCKTEATAPAANKLVRGAQAWEADASGGTALIRAFVDTRVS